MSKHAELISRLEAAEVGSDDLDCEMHDAATGEENFVHGIYSYTTSLDAALALAERVFGAEEAVWMLREVLVDFSSDIKRLPVALCIAILKALEAQQ